jgi:hypothetical protein
MEARERWLSHWVLQRWRHRVWSRKPPACGVDLIDLAPIPDADAILLTDTTNRKIFRFHRRDVYSTLINNICMSDEMLPCPRPPTNPYTNSPLTLAQTIALCQKLLQDYAMRGRCPPVLFSAFWASRFDLERFQREHASLLGQYAITSYFRDMTPENLDTVFDTMTTLMAEAGCDFVPTDIRRWLRDTTERGLRTEWLHLIRDYVLYINLNIQARPHWVARAFIMGDVRRLAERTTFPDTRSSRSRELRTFLQQLTTGGIGSGLFSGPSPLFPSMPATTLPSSLFLALASTEAPGIVISDGQAMDALGELMQILQNPEARPTPDP